MPTLSTFDGLSLHYETHGFDEPNPPVVFLNGLTQTTRNWTTHTRTMHHRFRVITYDARGQGQSDIPDDAPQLEVHARDLEALLDELDVDRAHLVGFSHGARVALGFAADYPERVDHMVLTSATARPTALARTIVRCWAEILKRGGLESLAWAAIPHIVGNDFLEQHGFLLDNIVRASVDRNPEEGTRLLLDGLREFPDLSGLAERIQAPTLVICADADPLVTPEGARKLADLCDGQFELVENSGHTVPIERPDKFRELITDFLSNSR